MDLIKEKLKLEVFLMMGNSLKHLPFHTTWAHERIDFKVEHENFYAFEKITDVLKII